MTGINPDIVLARQVGVDVPEPDASHFTAEEKANKDAAILMGRCDDAWSLQAIAEGIRRGRCQADEEHRATIAALDDRLAVMEAALQPFARTAGEISSFWDDRRFVWRFEKAPLMYRDLRMAARAVGLPASIEEQSSPGGIDVEG